MRHNKLTSLSQKEKNALREIELIYREFRTYVADYKKGEYITTIYELLSDYLDEIVMVVKKLKYSEAQ